MSDLPRTMTVLELINHLMSLGKQDRKFFNYKVYLSNDPEGNGFATIDPEWSIQQGDEDKIVVITPFADGLQNEDIAPIEDARVQKEVEAEIKAMKEKK